MLNKSDYIQAGILAKPHGISGETAIRLLPEAADWEFDPSFIFLDIDTGLVPFRVDEFRYKGSDILLVKLPLLSTEEQIRKYMEADVYFDPEEIKRPTPGFDNLSAFNGFLAKDINHGQLGIIQTIQNISGNPLFIIEGKSGELMIPVAEEFIVNIDDNARIIELKLPDGLVDLNEG